ncbi:hypothetical protein PVK06_040277 [Gossypium arboreum]|uniref:Uncharacterized protein n=1 Tax=Gossypium arboreum TaxID=29729 RepID=A0ABR0N5S2_GOSAR|nr:hypothetical protein PVK06_040277 [Gossypium arboreum]
MAIEPASRTGNQLGINLVRGSTNPYRFAGHSTLQRDSLSTDIATKKVARRDEDSIFGASEFDLLRRMVEILGEQPPDYVLKEAKAKNTKSQIRLPLIDFLRGLVEFDPAKRWSLFQASKHPFVTGEPFTRPYRPPPETPHLIIRKFDQLESRRSMITLSIQHFGSFRLFWLMVINGM